jgi:hypothetical protein
MCRTQSSGVSFDASEIPHPPPPKRMENTGFPAKTESRGLDNQSPINACRPFPAGKYCNQSEKALLQPINPPNKGGAD